MPSTVRFQDIIVPTPGFGAMSLSHGYGLADEATSLKVLAKAYELGCTFWDTAAVYGMGHNEALIGRFLRENNIPRDKVFVGSKCGFDIDFEKKTNNGVTNSADHINKFIELTKERLGSYPDLYYLHRIDPNTPLEESIPALDGLKKSGKVKYIGLSEPIHRIDPNTPLEESIPALDGLKKSGKVKYIGLSEPSAKTLRKACSIAHIDALQIEYSPWFTDHEHNDLIAAAHELGVTIVAYSPLGKGALTGAYRDRASFASDIRGTIPRFSEENYEGNLRLVDAFASLAANKGCTPGQLSLAWVAAQGAIPIPGTKRVGRVEENWAARDVSLTEEELVMIRKVITEAEPKGARYGDVHLKMVGL